jgi:hypothetical protein
MAMISGRGVITSRTTVSVKSTIGLQQLAAFFLGNHTFLGRVLHRGRLLVLSLARRR